VRSVEEMPKAQRGAARMVRARGGEKAEGREAEAMVTSPGQLLRSFAETFQRQLFQGGTAW